jgi:hypothetical protein
LGGRGPHRNAGVQSILSNSSTGSSSTGSEQDHKRHKAQITISFTAMSLDGAGVSEYVVGHDSRSSDAGPSTNPHVKLTNCPLQPMGVIVGASAAAADAEIEQLPEDEGPVVVPLEGAGEGIQAYAATQ